MNKNIKKFYSEMNDINNMGYAFKVSDDIVHVRGLLKVQMSEMVKFELEYLKGNTFHRDNERVISKKKKNIKIIKRNFYKSYIFFKKYNPSVGTRLLISSKKILKKNMINIILKINVSVQDMGNTFYMLNTIIIIIAGYFEVFNGYIVVERVGYVILPLAIIFKVRRLLVKSRNYRIIVVFLKRYYPKILLLRKSKGGLDGYDMLQFSISGVIFYIERVLTYYLIGTKVAGLKPYRKNLKRNEFILVLIKEILLGIWYIITYIIKKIYEIIIFLDNATIYTLIKHNMLLFLIIINVYIIMGYKYIFLFILSILIGFIIKNVKNIYLNCRYMTGNIENLNQVLLKIGFYSQLLDLKAYINKSQSEVCLYNKVLKYKNILGTIKKKYGIEEAAYYELSLTFLKTVEKTEICTLVLFKSEDMEIDGLVAKTEYATKFGHKVNITFIKTSGILHLKGFLKYHKEFYDNLAHVQLLFLYEGVFFYLQGNKVNNNYYILLYKNGMMNKFYEFNDIMKFVKFIEKRIEQEGGNDAFFKKYYCNTKMCFKSTDGDSYELYPIIGCILKMMKIKKFKISDMKDVYNIDLSPYFDGKFVEIIDINPDLTLEQVRLLFMYDVLKLLKYPEIRQYEIDALIFKTKQEGEKDKNDKKYKKIL